MAVGQPFDPARHEAIMQQESAEAAPNTVLMEMVKGYTMHDKLIRPAAVAVARAPSAPAPDAGAGGGSSGGTDGGGTG